jgi:hypothetical protein
MSQRKSCFFMPFYLLCGLSRSQTLPRISLFVLLALLCFSSSPHILSQGRTIRLNGFSSDAARFDDMRRQTRLWDTAAKFLPTGNPAGGPIVSPIGDEWVEFTQTGRLSGLEAQNVSFPLLQTLEKTLEIFPDIYIPPARLFETSLNGQTATGQELDSRSIFDRKPTAASLREQARENVKIAHLVSRAPMKEILRLKSDI